MIMASWGWFFVAILAYNIFWLMGYRVGYKDAYYDILVKEPKYDAKEM